MDHLPSPFSPLPLQTNHQSETSSPPSSRTTSPPASPTSRKNPHFTAYHQPTSHPNEPDHPHAVSILPCAVLRGRSSMMVLRRRPSAIDMALSEERSRCDGNAIERQGLDLMEPRPVGMGMNSGGFERVRTTSGSTQASGRLGASAAGVASASGSPTRDSTRRVSGSVNVNQPRFVMGGIFEVMEGRA